MKHTLIFATSNHNKVKEIRGLLPSNFDVKSLADIGFDEDIPETSPTIHENAIQKAKYLFERLHLPCFAEDTGLEVKALNGEPGIYSARYAGADRNPEKNMEKLLSKLKGTNDRSARFKTVIAYIDDQGSVSTFEGIVIGTIISEKRGKMGFGYDPIFIPDGFDQSFAQMTLAQKANISHRSRALKKFLAQIAPSNQ